MVRRRCAWSGAGAFLLALGSVVPAQESARFVADLGDPERSEAAERALLQLGPKAVPALQDQLDGWDTSTPHDVDRMRAVLRVIDLLGETALPLGPTLSALGKRDRGPLLDEVCDVRASLVPYAREERWHEQFHKRATAATPTTRAAAMATFVRFAARGGVNNRDDAAAMRSLLAQDEIYAREVAAEALAGLGDEQAIDLLRARLLDRTRRPKGWDQLRHNGFVVPLDDQFRWRASEALIRLAPDDVRSAVGHANRALLHPHRSVRIEALQALARFGPAAEDAIPELLQLAQRDDEQLATEALKLLGMAGRGVGEHLAAIEALQQRTKGPVERLAHSLAARLRAMGFEPRPVAAPPPGDAALAGAVSSLTDVTTDEADAAAARVLAAGDAAWPSLVDRLRNEADKVPDRVLHLLGQLGPTRTGEERDELRHALALAGGDAWQSTMMGYFTSGEGMRRVHREVYGELTIGGAKDPAALAAYLTDDNAAVRLAAARALAARRSAVAAGDDARLE
ncbi:MAG TPA: HEAT repeat domain-containing protein, partial [Planctomycetota bacterium]|nr:HEAT repeat domain-containing protein [Planctomycetota bacterium]